MRRAITVIALVAAAALVGCKRSPKHDRGTPEGTVRAFFDALDAKRIPADLDEYFTNDHEVAVWQMRCKHRGCTGGKLGKLVVETKYEYRAVVRIDYEVYGENGRAIMRGNAPVTLTREGKRWYIHQFGEPRVIQTGNHTASPDRGGAAIDSGAGL